MDGGFFVEIRRLDRSCMSDTKARARHADRLTGLDLERARAYCRRLMKSDDEAEDIVQEGLLRMMERAPIDLPGDSLQRYFMRSLTHIALNELERSRRRDESMTVEPPERRSSEPGRGLEVDQVRRRIDAAMSGLAPRSRAAVLLREREGLSFREIGDILEMSETAAATTVYRALKSLKSMLGDFIEEVER